MGSIISAIGTATPDHCFAQHDILKFMVGAHRLNSADTGRLKKLYDLSGINYRHSVIEDFGLPAGKYAFFGNGDALEPFPDTRQRGDLYQEHAWKVAFRAANNLLSKTRLAPEDISHLITVSCTGMYAPGLDIDMVENLGLKYDVERTCINFMGCYGAFNALKTADYICRARPEAKVLIVDVELCTLHFQRESTLNNWIANSLFSDGAAAVLVESSFDRSTDNGLSLENFYNTLALDSKSEMGWYIGNTGYEMILSSQVAKRIKGKIKAVTSRLLEQTRLHIHQIAHFAIHPGGRRILEVCEEELELPEESLEASYDVLKDFGNMSSATVLFVLKDILSKADKGEKTMSFAFGPGLTIESMVLQAV